jgi:hypothetical protein
MINASRYFGNDDDDETEHTIEFHITPDERKEVFLDAYSEVEQTLLAHINPLNPEESTTEVLEHINYVCDELATMRALSYEAYCQSLEDLDSLDDDVTPVIENPTDG